jgi:hypothetical protein
MGIGRRTPESETDKQIRRQMKEEEAEKKRLLAAEEKLMKRYSRGLIGPRSLMSRAGGRGFYREGKEID